MEDLFNLKSQLEFVVRYLELAEQPAYTPVEEFYSSLHRRDWTFTYSDDRRCVLAGRRHLEKLQAQFEALCQANLISPEDIEITKPLLNEFVSDIEPSTLERVKELEGKLPTIKLNPCYKLIELGRPPASTYLLKEIHKDLLNLHELLKNVGTTNNKEMFVYSPYMIKPRDLNSTVYKDTYGKIMYGHVAISKRAEKAIDDFFNTFGASHIWLYLRVAPYESALFDLLNVDMNNGEFKRHLKVGNALIALPPRMAEFAIPDTPLMDQLYRRAVTPDTLESVALYRTRLIELIKQEEEYSLLNK